MGLDYCTNDFDCHPHNWQNIHSMHSIDHPHEQLITYAWKKPERVSCIVLILGSTNITLARGSTSCVNRQSGSFIDGARTCGASKSRIAETVRMVVRIVVLIVNNVQTIVTGPTKHRRGTRKCKRVCRTLCLGGRDDEHTENNQKPHGKRLQWGKGKTFCDLTEEWCVTAVHQLQGIKIILSENNKSHNTICKTSGNTQMIHHMIWEYLFLVIHESIDWCEYLHVYRAMQKKTMNAHK